MLVIPAFAELTTFHLATSTCAWWQVERSPNALFSLMAASITSGGAPKNLIPSAPFLAFSLTHVLASSAFVIGVLLPCPKAVYANMRGAVMVFSKDFVLCSSTHDSPLPADGSLMVVIPCAIHNLKTYSAGVPCSFPPI